MALACLKSFHTLHCLQDKIENFLNKTNKVLHDLALIHLSIHTAFYFPLPFQHARAHTHTHTHSQGSQNFFSLNISYSFQPLFCIQLALPGECQFPTWHISSLLDHCPQTPASSVLPWFLGTSPQWGCHTTL